MARSLVLLLLLAACSPCALESGVAGFVPQCDQAVLREYEDEIRLAIPGTRATLVAYLPARLEVGARYGGTSGNYLTVVLDEQLAVSPGSSLDLWSFDPPKATGALHAVFSAGTVDGDWIASIEQGQ